MAKLPNKQHYLNQLDKKFKLTISNTDYTVQCPLPDGVGMTLGSEYSEPFDTAAVSGLWQKVFAVGGASSKIGISMKKMFTNPEPTEMSFEMELTAYFSAKDEVFMPIVHLCNMTLGSRITWKDVSEKTRELAEMVQRGADAVSEYTGVSGEDVAADTSSLNSDSANLYGGKLLGLIGLIQSPKQVKVEFGSYMTWRRMYITSIAPQFSNKVDRDGYPMSAKVSVTITPETYPVADDMLSVFGLPEDRQ